MFVCCRGTQFHLLIYLWDWTGVRVCVHLWCEATWSVSGPECAGISVCVTVFYSHHCPAVLHLRLSVWSIYRCDLPVWCTYAICQCDLFSCATYPCDLFSCAIYPCDYLPVRFAPCDLFTCVICPCDLPVWFICVNAEEEKDTCWFQRHCLICLAVFVTQHCRHFEESQPKVTTAQGKDAEAVQIIGVPYIMTLCRSHSIDNRSHSCVSSVNYTVYIANNVDTPPICFRETEKTPPRAWFVIVNIRRLPSRVSMSSVIVPLEDYPRHLCELDLSDCVM